MAGKLHDHYERNQELKEENQRYGLREGGSWGKGLLGEGALRRRGLLEKGLLREGGSWGKGALKLKISRLDI